MVDLVAIVLSVFCLFCARSGQNKQGSECSIFIFYLIHGNKVGTNWLEGSFGSREIRIATSGQPWAVELFVAIERQLGR